MEFRQARISERQGLFAEGYKVWSSNRTFEKYCADNSREDDNGIRYVLDKDGEIVSSLMLLRLNDYKGSKVYGIGSVLTTKQHQGKGYATVLLLKTIETITGNSMIFLHSDIDPGFYARMGFRALPDKYQKKQNSVCMLRCSDEIWGDLTLGCEFQAPGYF